MKKIQNLLNEQSAKSLAGFMKNICYIIIFIFTCGLVLSLMGRQTFTLHTRTETYNNAIYSETSRDWTFRGPTASLKDEIRVVTDQSIDLITQIGISAMYAVNVIPLMVCFWLLSRVFDNIRKGRIFIEQNANFLLYYGLVQIGTALLVPSLKILISYTANLFTISKVYISTGQGLISGLVSNVAFIVAAYIIHYGVHLQDEVDHTL